MTLEKALMRPKNYNSLSARLQWKIDVELGILDWDPTKEEIKKYREMRKGNKNENVDGRSKNNV